MMLLLLQWVKHYNSTLYHTLPHHSCLKNLGETEKLEAIHDAVCTYMKIYLTLAFKKLFSDFTGCYTMCISVLANTCVHLGVMICEIICCPSELEPLRTSSLLSKPVIPPSLHKEH